VTDKYGNPWPMYRVSPANRLTPLQAVRRFCLDCVCGVSAEVELCPVEGCSLYPFRFGNYPANHQGAKTVLKPIRAKCVDCMPEPLKRGQVAVRDCERKSCPIHAYRMGTNPSLIGKRGKGVPIQKSGHCGPQIEDQPFPPCPTGSRLTPGI